MSVAPVNVRMVRMSVTKSGHFSVGVCMSIYFIGPLNESSSECEKYE